MLTERPSQAVFDNYNYFCDDQIGTYLWAVMWSTISTAQSCGVVKKQGLQATSDASMRPKLAGSYIIQGLLPSLFQQPLCTFIIE